MLKTDSFNLDDSLKPNSLNPADTVHLKNPMHLTTNNEMCALK